MTQYDTPKFHGYWPSNMEVTEGGGGGVCPPPAIPDSEKPGLFKVNSATVCYGVDDKELVLPSVQKEITWSKEP